MADNLYAGASLESRFFIDDGLWRAAPLLTGQGSFDPLPEVRNILVTGGEGFIASWVVRHLTTKYPNAYNVVSFDKLDYCSSRNNSRMLEGRTNFTFFHGDVTSREDVLRCLRKFKIDVIVHLAAQTHVDLSFGNSLKFSWNNFIGTHQLLECAQHVGTVKRFYHISTDEVYGEVGMDADDLHEHTRVDPTNPYAATKAAAESMVTAFAHSFKLPIVLIRLNNVYGPHQYPEKIIPKFTNLLQRRRPLFIHGDGKHTRRYLYAGDAADAIDTIIHCGDLGQTYNVDSRDEICNFDLAKKLLYIFGIIANSSNGGPPDDGVLKSWIQYTVDRPFNDRRYAVDGTKLRKLGWKQRVTFEEGLARTVEWYGRFSGWWGPIENILAAPFPVVAGDHVVDAEVSRKAEKGVNGGAQNGGNGVANGGNGVANGGNGVAHIGNGVANGAVNGHGKRKVEDHAVDAAVLDGHAMNGGVEPMAKKRKAEVMT